MQLYKNELEVNKNISFSMLKRIPIKVINFGESVETQKSEPQAPQNHLLYYGQGTFSSRKTCNMGRI